LFVSDRWSLRLAAFILPHISERIQLWNSCSWTTDNSGDGPYEAGITPALHRVEWRRNWRAAAPIINYRMDTHFARCEVYMGHVRGHHTVSLASSHGARFELGANVDEHNTPTFLGIRP
jgi:hypothetical protein